MCYKTHKAAWGVCSMPKSSLAYVCVPISVHSHSSTNLYKTFPTNCSSIFLTSLLNTSTSFQQFSDCLSCSLRHETTSSLASETSFGRSFSTFRSPNAFCSFSISSCTFLLLAFFFLFSSSVSVLKRSFGVIDGSSSRPGCRSDFLDVSLSSLAVIFWRAFSRREEFSFVNLSSSAATLCWMCSSKDLVLVELVCQVCQLQSLAYVLGGCRTSEDACNESITSCENCIGCSLNCC